MRKAISPLVATALLMIITIGLAVLILSDFTSFTNKSADEAISQSKKTVECSFAAIRIPRAVVNTSVNQVSLTVSNEGKDALSISQGILYFTDGTYCNIWNESTLDSGDSESKTSSCAVSGCDSISHIRLDTTCNGVSAEVRDSIECE